MKSIFPMIAATLFAAGVSAADVYHGLDEGNSDLSTGRLSAEDFVGAQPGIGDITDRYHGWAKGNSDLFETDYSGPTDAGNDPDIYMNVSGNSDLSF